MTAVLHVIDAGIDETSLQIMQALATRLATDGVRHTTCSIDGRMADWASHLLCTQVVHAERRLPAILNWSPAMAVTAQRSGAQIVHAWGIEAARICISRLPHVPLVLTLLEPADAIDAAKWVRSFPADATIVAGSQVIRTRLLTAGMNPQRVVVIRGGVDFGAINSAKDASLRSKLVGDGGPVVLISGPPSRDGGHYFGLWALAIVAQIHRSLRIVMPYRSDESDRMRRFVRKIKMQEMLVVPDEKSTWAELVSGADLFVVPAVEDICTEPIGWAMAAGVVVVGSAVRSVTEIIADKHNGLLCKAGEARALASRILVGLEDADLRRKVTDTARGQAYDVFSMRAFTDHYRRLYENLLISRDPGEGITDTAMVA